MSQINIAPGGSRFLADGVERPVNNEQEAKELLKKSGREYAVLVNEIGHLPFGREINEKRTL